MKTFPKGAYPAMITPFHEDGSIDYPAVNELLRWYERMNCSGVLALCASSETETLSLEERVELTKYIVEHKGNLIIIASGHVSTSLEDQLTELNAMAETGIDGLCLIVGLLNQNNETEQPTSHINLADLAVIRHPFSAGDPQCLDTTKAHTDQCPNQIDSLGIILFLNYAGDGAQGHPVGPEVLCHTKGGQSHQGYADPLDHKIKQGASQFYASGG